MPVSLGPGLEIFLLPQLIVIAMISVAGIVQSLRANKIPAWLKGGLIALGIAVLVSILTSLLEPQIFLAIFFALPIFVIGIIIGAIAGHIRTGKEANQQKGLKIGFWTGLILGLAIYLFFVLNGKWWVPAAWVFSIGAIAVSTLIGWIAGKLSS